MTAEISHRRPCVLETTRSHASLGKTPYSPPATPGLPPSAMLPLDDDTKDTRADALSSSDDDSPRSLRSPPSSTKRTHRPPTPPPPPPGKDAGDVADVLCRPPSFSSTLSLRHHTCSLHQHQEQEQQHQQKLETAFAADPQRLLEHPSEYSVTGGDPPRADSPQQDVAMDDATQHLPHVAHETTIGYPEDMHSTFLSSRPSSIYAQQKQGQQIVHHQPLPYRHSRRNSFSTTADYCYHYSPAFPSPASQQAARSSLRRLRRRSLHRSNGLTGGLNTNPAIHSMSTMFTPPSLSWPLEHEQQLQQQQQQQPVLPPSPPPMQPFGYSPTCLRGRRRVTIEKCMHAWEQQQENAGDDQQNGSSGSSIRTVGYEAECRESNSHNGSSPVDGVTSAATSSLAHRPWGKASNDDWSRPPPLLHLPHTRVWQAEIEEDIEEEDWGSPEVVAAMRPLSSATACWTDVAVVDSGEGGLHLGPWASTAY